MSESTQPSPALFWDYMTGFQKSAAIRAAVDIGIFTHIGTGATTVPAIAEKSGAGERGVRILADYLTAAGFLTKADGEYGLTPDSAVFLDQKSPAYLGNMVQFLQHEEQRNNFLGLTEAVKLGTLPDTRADSLGAEHPMWIEFARSMQGIMAPAAEFMANVAADGAGDSLKTLDIAAGHGLFGIAVAKRCPQAEVVAVDWPGVLTVAEENARAAGVSDRHTLLPGDAFKADYGSELTNFFHHFDRETNITLMRRVREAMRPGGRVMTLEFVPDDDHVSPPDQAMFAIIMLANTPFGDVYTLSEYDAMFREAGFGESKLLELPNAPQRLIVTSA
jgi:hypothetical protein